MGTKKHQLNGVELTCTAIGIEIGNFAVNSPHPFLSSYIVILQYHPYHKYTQNHDIKIIHLFIGWKWAIHPNTPINITIQNTTSHIS